jgi:hypothetical protein
MSKTQKSHVNAKGTHETVNLNIKLVTKQTLTPDELRRDRKTLNDHLCEALHSYGFHYQDIEVA